MASARRIEIQRGNELALQSEQIGLKLDQIITNTGPSGVTSQEWIEAVRQGIVTGYSLFNVQGYAPAMGTSFQTVWQDNSVGDYQALYDTPSTVKFASTDASDGSGLFGAQQVTIIGVGASNEVITETKDLNGTTEVTTTNIFKAINSVFVAAAGNFRQNQGDIWVGNGVFTAGVPATKYTVIPTNFNIAKTGVYTVPAGKTASLYSIVLQEGDTSKGVDFRIISYNGSLKNVVAPLELGAGDLATRTYAALPLAAGVQLSWEGKVSTGTANVAVFSVLLLRDV